MPNKHILFIIICGIIAAIGFEAPVAWGDTSENQALDYRKEIQKGEVSFRAGDYPRALEIWENAIGLVNTDKDAALYMDTLASINTAYQAIGLHRKALSHFQKALPIAEKSKDSNRNALFFSGMGDLFLYLGNIREAVTYLEKGLEEARKGNNPRVLAGVLNTVGNALTADENYEDALDAFAEAVELAKQLPDDDSLKSMALISWSRILFQAGEYKEMVTALDTASHQIRVLKDSYEKVSNLLSLSQLFRDILPEISKENPEVLYRITRSYYEILEDAMRISEVLKDARSLSYSCGYLGELYEFQKRYPEALTLTRKAVFFAPQINAADILYLWQWQMGRIYKAQGDIDKALIASRDAVATLNPIRSGLMKGYRIQKNSFAKNIKPVYLELAALLLKQAETYEDKAEKESRLKEVIQTMELLKTAELQDFFQDECVTSALTENRMVYRTTDRTALIYPILLPDRLVLLLILPDSIRLNSISLNTKLFDEAIIRFRKGLQTCSNNRFFKESWQLYDWLIRPVEQELKERQIDTLVISPDGALRLIPFAALHDGKHFLIETYAITTIPAMTLTDPKFISRENPDILLCGISKAVQDFPPLSKVPEEIRDIKSIMNGKIVLQDKDYSLKNLRNEFKNKSYSIVHLATHGVFGSTPDETFLLTYDDRLTMDRLESLIGLGRYREKKVELLTLCACQTAIGDERAALGLAGVAVKAGVRSAIASLWFIDDEATSLVIREFYRQFKTPGVSKAKALQQAQIRMLSQLRYRHPGYWGPFLLIGNWL